MGILLSFFKQMGALYKIGQTCKKLQDAVGDDKSWIPTVSMVYGNRWNSWWYRRACVGLSESIHPAEEPGLKKITTENTSSENTIMLEISEIFLTNLCYY